MGEFRKSKGLTIARILCVVFVAVVSQVSSGLAAEVVAIGDFAVVEHGRGHRDARTLNIYAAGTAKRPHLVGSIRTHNQSHALQYLVAHKRYVLAQYWTELEVYDISDPVNPHLVRIFNLKPNHAPWAGGGMVVDGEIATILNTTVSAELRMRGQPQEWSVVPLRPTTELGERTEGLYNDQSRRANPDDFAFCCPRTIYLNGGVFVVEWIISSQTAGLIKYEQHLRLVGSKARVLIDTAEETID